LGLGPGQEHRARDPQCFEAFRDHGGGGRRRDEPGRIHRVDILTPRSGGPGVERARHRTGGLKMTIEQGFGMLGFGMLAIAVAGIIIFKIINRIKEQEDEDR